MADLGFAGGLAAALLAAGLGVSACGGGTSPGQERSSPAGTVTPSATGATAPVTAGASGPVAGIPFYRPSAIVSQAGGSAVLTSPDPVRKVSAYYVSVVDNGGWTTVSRSITASSGNLTIRKPGRGATISVAPSGSGSVISISTYPAP